MLGAIASNIELPGTCIIRPKKGGIKWIGTNIYKDWAIWYAGGDEISISGHWFSIFRGIRRTKYIIREYSLYENVAYVIRCDYGRCNDGHGAAVMEQETSE